MSSSAILSDSSSMGGSLQIVPAPLLCLNATIPVPLLPQTPVTATTLADVIARHGMPCGLVVAAGFHREVNPTNPPTVSELLGRVHKMPADLVDKYHQDLPNALALRLLAARPGQIYGLEARVTTNKKGERLVEHKCLDPGCPFVGKDKKRHMSGMHVKDIDTALCCPYESCGQIYYATRESEMKKHFKWHEGKNEDAQSNGEKTTPLSSFL